MKIVKTLLAILAALILAGCAADPAGEVRESDYERNHRQRMQEMKKDLVDRLAECNGTGLISGCKFSPLQIHIGKKNPFRIVDETADTVFSLGLLNTEQRSAVFTVAPLYSLLGSNYGLQTSVVYLAARSNYGVSFGLWNDAVKNYGAQVGLVVMNYDEYQWVLCGMNIAGKVLVGIINNGPSAEDGKNVEPSFLQLGVFNGGDSAVQLGLLNFNSRSYIDLLPLVNFAMKKDGGK